MFNDSSSFQLTSAAAWLSFPPAGSELAALCTSKLDAAISPSVGTPGGMRRVDAAHRTVPIPVSSLSWRCDVSRCHSIANRDDLLPSSPEPPKGVVGSAATISDRAQSARQKLPLPTRVADEETNVSENLTALLAEAAHEIRSPLAVARQLLYTVRQRLANKFSDSKGTMQYVDSAAGRLQQATQWSENILVRRRLVDRQPVVARKRFFPAQLASQVAPVLMELTQARNVELEWIGWDRSLPRLYIDPDHLSRVLINLVSNAVSSSRSGQRISARVAWQTNVVQRLVIAIEDRGPGLSQEMLAFINGPKLCLPREVAQVRNGIGLQNAKQLTAAMGGVLSAHNSPDGGAVFRLSLPVDDRASLIRSWLDQQAKLRSWNQNRQVENSLASPTHREPILRLYVMRFRGVDRDHSSELSERIQRQAGANDLVYKVAYDRWLWLSLDCQDRLDSIRESLALAAKHPSSPRLSADNWLIQQVKAWPWTSAATFSDERDERATFTTASILITLAQQVCAAMEKTIGKAVPPLDSLESLPETNLAPHFSASHPPGASLFGSASSTAPTLKPVKYVPAAADGANAIAHARRPTRPRYAATARPVAREELSDDLAPTVAHWRRQNELLKRSIRATNLAARS